MDDGVYEDFQLSYKLASRCQRNSLPCPHAIRSWWRDLRLALGFMTRLPVGVIEGDLAAASWAFPLAGLLGGRRAPP